LLIALCATTALGTGCLDPFELSIVHSAPPAPEAARRPPSLIALTSAATGQVMLLDRSDLSLLRTIEPERHGPATGPMHVIEDATRRVFYVGNFNGGLGRIPMDGGELKTLDLGGVIIGVAISPDGRLLAVNGARDLTLRLVDLNSWKRTASVRFGNPDDKPRHSHMTHGMASTHPIWLRDGSGILTEDNIHEEVVLIGSDGKEQARRRLPSGVHTFLTTKSGEVLALAEGTVDGTVPPHIVVLTLPSLDIVREIIVPIGPQEPAKLHHAALSLDEEVLVVANMGPMHGERYGTTVAALHWRTGQVAWHVPTVRNAGHVRFLDQDRVIVLGHHDPNLEVLDVRTGQRRETWKVPDANALGHSLAAEAGDTVLVVDSSAGRLVRVGRGGVKNQSPDLGKEVNEASLPE
jgi:hypothetical protein